MLAHSPEISKHAMFEFIRVIRACFVVQCHRGEILVLVAASAVVNAATFVTNTLLHSKAILVH